MTREELHTFAAAGVAQKIAGIERELAVYHKEWPELFMSATAPQLLKPTLKNGNNGHAPAPAPKPATDSAGRRKAIRGVDPEARRATLRAALADGPQTLEEMQNVLETKGQFLSRSALQKFLRVDLHGTAKKMDGHWRWTLNDAPKKHRMSKATRRKLALAMKRRHATGQIARAKAKAAAAKAAAARGN